MTPYSFPEYSERTCKEEYVQKHISSIHCHCFDLLAVGFLWILGFRIRSPTIYFSFFVYSRMDCSYGKFICSYSNIWMLSGRQSLLHCNMRVWFYLKLLVVIIVLPSFFYPGRERGKWEGARVVNMLRDLKLFQG